MRRTGITQPQQFLNVDARHLVSLNVAATALGLAYYTVKRLMLRGTLPYTTTAMGSQMVDLRDVMRLKEEFAARPKKAHPGRPSLKDQLAAQLAKD